MIALIRMLVDIDVRAVLPSVSVPTRILHRDRDVTAPIEGARWVAEQIRGARLVELEGEHSPLTGDTEAILDQVEEFVTGRRSERQPDRVLATVMFTDIVHSTVQAAALGDRRWAELLDGHRQLVRQQLRRFGGQEIKTIGDGFLATFDVVRFDTHPLRPDHVDFVGLVRRHRVRDQILLQTHIVGAVHKNAGRHVLALLTARSDLADRETLDGTPVRVAQRHAAETEIANRAVDDPDVAVAVDRDALTARRIRAVDQVTTEVDRDVVGGHG